MSSKAVDKSGWDTQDKQNALHHDGLSRFLSLLGLSHLSSQQSRLLAETLAGEAKYLSRRGEITATSSDAVETHLPSSSSSSSSSSLSLLPTSTLLSAFLPSWNQIHSRRCNICDNTLFLGVNCSSTNNGFIKCLVCQSELPREEPVSEVKRKFRSVACRQRRKSREMKLDAEAHPTPMMNVDGKEKSSLRKSKSLQQTAKTLKQRAKDLKRIEKERRKMEKDVKRNEGKADREVGLVNQKKETTPIETESITVKAKKLQPRSTAIDKEKEAADSKDSELKESRLKTDKSSINRERKRKEPSGAKQNDALRQMLAMKRAKQEQSKPSTGGGSGLQDFLGSL